MKKNQHDGDILKYLRKTLRIMRLSLFLIIISTAMAFSADSYSQNAKLTMDLNNVTVKEVIKAIENQSEFLFFYQEKHVDLNRQVTLHATDQDMETILNQLFAGTDNIYVINDRQIVIGKAPRKELEKQIQSIKGNVKPEIDQPQQKEITGKVTDAEGLPLPGVSVIIKGTTIGTITDTNGDFTLRIPVNSEILQFSFVGMQTQEIPIEGKSNFSVTLAEDIMSIEEVVAVGYGAVKKSDLTGSVSSIKMKDITDFSSSSIDGLLQGRAAGLQVMNTSQDPGSGSIIRIRGNSSLRGSNTPLVVVNGFPLGDAGNLSHINPSNIESIEVLKDASASAIYGSRGANGVILITTQSAKSGVTNVSIKHQTVASQLSDKLDIWHDPMLMAQVTNEEQFNAGLTPLYIGQTIGGIYYPSLTEIQEGRWANTDWQDLTLRTPIVNNTSFSLNSAGERASFNLNVNYYNDQGIYKKDSYDRLNNNMGITYKLLDNVKLSSFNILSVSNRNISNNLEYGRNPLWPVYDENGNYFIAGPQDFGHPLIIMRDVKNKNTIRDFTSSFAIDWDIVQNLILHSGLDYRYKTTVGDVYRASTTSQDANNNKGIAQINNGIYQSLLSETYLTYKLKDLTVMVGHSYNYETNRGLYTTARGFVNDILENENMNASDPAKRDIYNDGFFISKLLSYYGRLNYSLNDKYLATFTMRSDGSTKFGKNNKWGYFPSGAISWKMHNESWLKDVEWLYELKLRTSYGISGNQGISSYQTLDRYGMEKFWNEGQWKTVIGPGYEVGRTGADNRYMVWGGVMNPDLKWETTAQFNIGIDIAFFNNRLRSTIDIYKKNTENLLREKYLTLSSGYDKMWVNEGIVTNNGFEISLNGDVINTKDWMLSGGFIYSMNRNKVVDLGDPISNGLSVDYRTDMYYEVTGPPIAMFNQNASIYGVGQPMNVFYGYKVDGIIQIGEDPGFIDPDALRDRPGELKYVDLTGDYAISPEDRTIIGDPNPDFTASFNISAQWKNLDLSVYLYGVYGNDILYNNYTFSPRVKAKRWTLDNPTNNFPRLNNNRQYLLSDYFIQDGSFLRIQNVSLGYNFDLKNSLPKSIRVFANVENLHTFTNFDGFDPEVGLDGIYWEGYPKFRKFALGIDIQF